MNHSEITRGFHHAKVRREGKNIIIPVARKPGMYLIYVPTDNRYYLGTSQACGLGIRMVLNNLAARICKNGYLQAAFIPMPVFEVYTRLNDDHEQLMSDTLHLYEVLSQQDQLYNKRKPTGRIKQPKIKEAA